MKRISYSLIGLMLLFASCETIENRKELGPVLKASQLSFAVTQNPAGSNKVVLKNNTPNTLQYWDWGTGSSNKLIDTITMPFAGTYTIRFTAFCDGGTVTDSTTFKIAANDNAYFDSDPAWKGLTNGGPGQTWVWALDITGGKIAGNGPENCTAPAWWTMTSSDGNVSGTLNDEVTIDLLGAANFSHKKGDGSITKGTFAVIAPYVNSGIKYSGIQITNGVRFPWPAPADGKYHITKMTANELVVHEYGQYNVAMFKRKGFSY